MSVELPAGDYSAVLENDALKVTRTVPLKIRAGKKTPVFVHLER